MVPRRLELILSRAEDNPPPIERTMTPLRQPGAIWLWPSLPDLGSVPRVAAMRWVDRLDSRRSVALSSEGPKASCQSPLVFATWTPLGSIP